MIIICAWCKRKMGEKEPIEDKSETHTICNECEEKISGKKVKDNPNDRRKR